MKEIQLTQGKVALVDDADYDWLNQWKWSAVKNKNGGNYYVVRGAHTNWRNNQTLPVDITVRKQIWMHNQILNTPDGLFPDHKNGNGLDNQRDNLRVCTRAQNQQNKTKTSSHKTSGFKGVSWSTYHNKWRAEITISKQTKSLGYFPIYSELDAALAYDKAAKKYFGEFALLNFP